MGQVINALTHRFEAQDDESDCDEEDTGGNTIDNAMSKMLHDAYMPAQAPTTPTIASMNAKGNAAPATGIDASTADACAPSTSAASDASVMALSDHLINEERSLTWDFSEIS